MSRLGRAMSAAIGGIAALVPVFGLLAAASAAEPARAPGAYVLPSQSSFWSEMRSRSSFEYYLRVNGPSIGGTIHGEVGESYNPFVSGRWPVQVFHSLTYGFRIDDKTTAALEGSAVQDVARGVVDKFGYPVNPAWTLFHPAVRVSRTSMLDNSLFSMSFDATVFFPTSSFAQKQTMLFSLALDQTWNVKLPASRWSTGLNTRIQPTAYKQALPQDQYDSQRRLLFISGGPFVNFRISDRFELANTSLFDCDKYAGRDSLLDFDSASDDRVQSQLNYYSPGRMARVGAYVQSVVFQPGLDTSTVGMDLTLTF